MSTVLLLFMVSKIQYTIPMIDNTLVMDQVAQVLEVELQVSEAVTIFNQVQIWVAMAPISLPISFQ